jgi:hypothetical protein
LVWLAAFAVIIVADFILLYMPDVPHKVSVLLTIGAFKFTVAYPRGPLADRLRGFVRTHLLARRFVQVCFYVGCPG